MHSISERALYRSLSQGSFCARLPLDGMTGTQFCSASAERNASESYALVAEQARRPNSGDELLGRSIVVPLSLGDLERQRQSECVDHDVDLRR